MSDGFFTEQVAALESAELEMTDAFASDSIDELGERFDIMDTEHSEHNEAQAILEKAAGDVEAIVTDLKGESGSLSEQEDLQYRDRINQVVSPLGHALPATAALEHMGLMGGADRYKVTMESGENILQRIVKTIWTFTLKMIDFLKRFILLLFNGMARADKNCKALTERLDKIKQVETIEGTFKFGGKRYICRKDKVDKDSIIDGFDRLADATFFVYQDYANFVSLFYKALKDMVVEFSTEHGRANVHIPPDNKFKEHLDAVIKKMKNPIGLTEIIGGMYFEPHPDGVQPPKIKRQDVSTDGEVGYVSQTALRQILGPISMCTNGYLNRKNYVDQVVKDGEAFIASMRVKVDGMEASPFVMSLYRTINRGAMHGWTDLFATFGRQAFLSIRAGLQYSEKCIEAYEKKAGVDAKDTPQGAQLSNFMLPAPSAA